MSELAKPIAALSAGLLARKGLARKPVLALAADDAAVPLRLAAAITGQSAQQLVTEAIDTMLGELAELEPLALRVAAIEG